VLKVSLCTTYFIHPNSNEEVLWKIEEEKPGLWNIMRKRRDVWVSHLIRHEGLIKTILESAVEGKKTLGADRGWNILTRSWRIHAAPPTQH
jgi:hypothetical protein